MTETTTLRNHQGRAAFVASSTAEGGGPLKAYNGEKVAEMLHIGRAKVCCGLDLRDDRAASGRRSWIEADHSARSSGSPTPGRVVHSAAPITPSRPRFATRMG